MQYPYGLFFEYKFLLCIKSIRKSLLYTELFVDENRSADLTTERSFESVRSEFGCFVCNFEKAFLGLGDR